MTNTPKRPPVEVLWCSNQRSGRSNGWSFPPRVNHLLKAFTDGKQVCQLFGGMSEFGVKLDIDVTTRPHVLGDAWLPPFVKDAFDVTIIDPPYIAINQQMKQQLLRAAAYIAREHVVWFHTMWVASDSSLRMERAWLVRVGDSCACRCIQVFKTAAYKPMPRNYFSRGPAMKYNRWLAGELPLPFNAPAEDPA